jgi:hypothetical protein
MYTCEPDKMDLAHMIFDQAKAFEKSDLLDRSIMFTMVVGGDVGENVSGSVSIEPKTSDVNITSGCFTITASKRSSFEYFKLVMLQIVRDGAAAPESVTLTITYRNQVIIKDFLKNLRGHSDYSCMSTCSDHDKLIRFLKKYYEMCLLLCM